MVLVAILVAVVLAGGGIVWLLAATVPAGAIALAATVAVLRNDALFAPAFQPAEWRRLLVLTLPVALALTSGTLYVYLVQVLTDTVASAEESGLFAASFRVFLVVGAIPGLVVSTAFPLLARAARDDRERLAYAVDGGAWQGAFCELALLHAWHVATCSPLAARMVYAMPEATAHRLAATPLWQVRRIADNHGDLLAPRWPTNPAFWPDLLYFAATGDAQRLGIAQLLGHQLIAAELEYAAARDGGGKRAPPPLWRSPRLRVRRLRG